jgi:hypothetical protein
MVCARNACPGVVKQLEKKFEEVSVPERPLELDPGTAALSALLLLRGS